MRTLLAGDEPGMNLLLLQGRFAEFPFYSVFVARFSLPNTRNLWPQIIVSNVHIAPELTLVNPGTNTFVVVTRGGCHLALQKYRFAERLLGCTAPN